MQPGPVESERRYSLYHWPVRRTRDGGYRDTRYDGTWTHIDYGLTWPEMLRLIRNIRRVMPGLPLYGTREIAEAHRKDERG